MQTIELVRHDVSDRTFAASLTRIIKLVDSTGFTSYVEFDFHRFKVNDI